MNYLSVCSGIEAATVAWHPLGWHPVAFSEIEPFPCAVLKHHYPDVPNLGDMTKYKEWGIAENIDLLVGGTPCQSFSVAGLRKGLADPRGNLALVFLGLVDHVRPRWVVWENVPGVLSSSRGRDFGAFLGALAELGYGFAYRVLDAQYFGVAQRRRRVFVVGHLGDWRPAAAVLFESHSLSGNPAPIKNEKEELQESDPCLPSSWWDGSMTSQTVDAVFYKKQCMPEKNRFPAVMIPAWQKCEMCEDYICNIHYGEHAFECDCPSLDDVEWWPYDPQVLRFVTPLEVERLQGFPDNYTNIPWRNKPNAPDGPRYKALGNSMAVPVMLWIGQRIQLVEDTE